MLSVRLGVLAGLDDWTVLGWVGLLAVRICWSGTLCGRIFADSAIDRNARPINFPKDVMKDFELTLCLWWWWWWSGNRNIANGYIDSLTLFFGFRIICIQPVFCYLFKIQFDFSFLLKFEFPFLFSHFSPSRYRNSIQYQMHPYTIRIHTSIEMCTEREYRLNRRPGRQAGRRLGVDERSTFDTIEIYIYVCRHLGCLCYAACTRNILKI